MEFDKVKSYLSQNVGDNESSIYSHLAEIAKTIVEEKPENAYQLFENISLRVKQSKLNLDQNSIPKILVNEQEREEIQRNIDSILTAYGRKPEPKVKENQEEDDKDDEENQEEDEEPIDITKCANILENQSLLSWAGIAIDNEEAFQLQNAFTRLVRQYPSIQNSRFWGKIQAISNDYYIVESKLSEYPEPNEDKPPRNEDPGKGGNEFVYFVTTNIETGDWRQLNDVTPEQIKKSRQINRLFTGDLDAKVCGRVHFPWTESELLRAQIARISSSTILCPDGYYQKPEEADEDNPFVTELNEEFAANEEGGAAQSNWIHQRGHLRKEGRLMKWIEPEKEDEEDDDEEKEEKEPTEEELEEQIEILQSIASDTSTVFGAENEEDESSNCWFIRRLNNDMPYAVVVINNKLWNGAKTVYVSRSKTFVNIYIGDGMKYNGVYYTPTAPLPIQSQFNEFKEIEVTKEADPDAEEEEEETVTKQVSIFSVQSEEMPPPPPQEEENNEDANDEDDTQDIE
eukprot:330287_1